MKYTREQAKAFVDEGIRMAQDALKASREKDGSCPSLPGSPQQSQPTRQEPAATTSSIAPSRLIAIRPGHSVRICAVETNGRDTILTFELKPTRSSRPKAGARILWEILKIFLGALLALLAFWVLAVLLLAFEPQPSGAVLASPLLLAIAGAAG